jgi:hypothetical protein
MNYDKEDKREALTALARSIAKHLAPDWTYRPRKPLAEGEYPQLGEYIDCTGKAGPALWLHYNWRDESRIVVSGEYPRGTDRQIPTRHNETLPEITISASRSPEALAKDIVRRFIPDYIKLWDDFQNRVKADLDYHQGQDATLERLAVAGGVKVESIKCFADRNGRGRISGGLFGGVWGEVEAYPDSVTLKLHSLSVEQAEKIIALLAEGRKESQNP